MIEPTDWLIGIGVRGAAALLVWSWQALALLALVWLALKTLRMKSPALRHQVWLFGLAAMATLPLQSIAAQSLLLPRPSRPVLNYVAEAPRMVIDLAPQPPARTLPEAAPNKTATAPAVKATTKTPMISRPPFVVLFAALFAVWMIGAMITLARLMKNHLGVRRALKRAQSVRPADLDCGEFAAFVSGGARLRLSTEVSSPVLCGVFRPTILMPADIADWTTPGERAAMIRHELAHVERRDPLANLFQAALSVIFFFHPLVRYACRQLSLEREMACDNRVVASGVAAEVYVASILKAAERGVMAVGAPGGAHQLAMLGARQILERRLEMILDTDRPRTLAHRRRYLVLPIALITAAGFLLIPRNSAQNPPSYSPAKDSPVKVTYSAQEQELIEMIRQVAEGAPQRWPPRYRKARGPEERLLFDDFRVYDKRSSLTIISPRPLQLFGVPRFTKVEVRDFEVSVNGDSAVIDFIGAMHFSFPDQDKDEVVTDPYRVELVKVNGQWRADRRNRDPLGGVMNVVVGAVSLPASLPKTPREWAALKVTTEIVVANNGDAEFSIRSSPSFDSTQSGEPLSGEPAILDIQNAVMKLGELELRGGKGARISLAYKCFQIHGPARGQSVGSGASLSPVDKCVQKIDEVHLNDRFELQRGERIYYGSGSVNAKYHSPDKQLRIGSFPEARFYRTPDRTGEAMTLQQVAQELRDQASRKN